MERIELDGGFEGRDITQDVIKRIELKKYARYTPLYISLLFIASILITQMIEYEFKTIIETLFNTII